MQCERLKGNGNIYTSVPRYIMYPWKKPFLSKATGSNGAFCWVAHCISLTKTDATVAPKQSKLKEVPGKWKGTGKLCAVLCWSPGV